jgi:hypothetical protein
LKTMSMTKSGIGEVGYGRYSGLFEFLVQNGAYLDDVI